MDRATNNAKRNLLQVNLWESYGTTSQRGLAIIFDPVFQPYPGDGLLIAGTEFQTNGSQRICEYRQVWLCRPVSPLS